MGKRKHPPFSVTRVTKLIKKVFSFLNHFIFFFINADKKPLEEGHKDNLHLLFHSCLNLGKNHPFELSRESRHASHVMLVTLLFTNRLCSLVLDIEMTTYKYLNSQTSQIILQWSHFCGLSCTVDFHKK